LSDQIKNEMGRACDTYWGAGNRPLGIPRHRWEDNIKMDLQEVGWEAWTGLLWLGIRDRWQALMNVVMKIRVL
jgi:hypothetical protein